MPVCFLIVKDVKTVGSYVAQVKLHKEVTAQVTFTVIAEGGVQPAPAAEEAAPAPEAEAPAEAAAE
jgi:large subunit ribosomal protein L9